MLRLCSQKHFFFVNGLSIWIIFSVQGLLHFQSLGFFLLEAKNTWLLNSVKHCDMSYILWVLLLLGSPSSLVVTATRLRAGQAGVRILVGIRDFPLLWNFQTGSRAHPASYSVGNGVVFQQLSDRLEMNGAIRLLPMYAFMAWAGKTLPLGKMTTASLRWFLGSKPFLITHAFE